MSHIKIINAPKKTLDRSAAMTSQLLELNQEWNRFVEANRGWITEYREKMHKITDGADSMLISKELMSERLNELFEQGRPRSAKMRELRERFMRPDMLPKYQKNLARMNNIEAPVPYYRDLILDEDVREEVDFVKARMDIRGK